MAEYWVVVNRTSGALLDIHETEPDAGSIEPEQKLIRIHGKRPSPSLYQWDASIESFQQIEAPIITVLAFRNRFTVTEKIAIYDARDTRKAGQGEYVQLFIDDLNVATFIDLSRPDTIQGVYMLESFGLIAGGRAAEILSAPITDEEMPQ